MSGFTWNEAALRLNLGPSPLIPGLIALRVTTCLANNVINASRDNRTVMPELALCCAAEDEGDALLPQSYHL